MAMDPLADFDREIISFLETAGIAPETIQLQTPNLPEHGERATNAAMQSAKQLRRTPRQIADEVASRFDPARHRFMERVEVAGPGFINFHLNYDEFVPHVISTVREAAESYGG